MGERVSPARGTSCVAVHPLAGGMVTVPPTTTLSLPSREKRDRVIQGQGSSLLLPSKRVKGSVLLSFHLPKRWGL